MYPHFVCPNCRTVADLEAELDDPFANGEWEDAPADAAEESSPEVEASTAAPATTAEEGSQENAVTERTPAEHVNQRDSSDVEPASDADSHPSGDNQRTPSSGSDSPPPAETSASSVQAVDIVPRRSISDAQIGFAQLPHRPKPENSTERTPSPSGISAIAEGMPEGPMTPRNDFGPFVFDGSAGRVRPITDVSTANVSADESEDTTQRTRTEATTAS
jgi:hypothetical protein